MSTVPSHISSTTSLVSSFYAHDFLVLLHPHILKAKTILDVGCGTGAFVYAYMNQYPNGIQGQTIISSDIDQYVIKEVKLAVKNIFENQKKNDKFYTKLIFQVEDGSQLRGIKDESIDIVVSIYGVFVIPNQKGTLQSIHRVLKSNHGIFANVAWTQPTFPESESSLRPTTNILMDPSFGGNFNAAFDHMNVTTMKALNFKVPSSTGNENMFMIEWVDPARIEQKLNDCYFRSTKTHRTLHSMVWANVDMVFDMSLQNPFININNLLSKQKIMTVKREFIKFCSNDEEHNKNDEKFQQPFTLWTASNITITQKGEVPVQQEQKTVLPSNIPSHISTTTSWLTTLYSNDFLILLHPHIKKAKMILEIGCGNRTFIRSYMQQYPNGIKGQTIILSDLDPDVIDEVRWEVNDKINTKRNHGQQFHTKIIVQTSDVDRLYDITDQSMDIVVSLYKVVLREDQKAILQSIHRVLKPNGIFANVAWAVPSVPPSTFTSSSTSDIMIDPSFGRNYHSTFYRMNITAMETLNKTLGSSSFFADHIDEDPTTLQWTEPTMIEKKLSECNFVRITNHRVLHSMVLPNSDILIDMCLENSNLSRAKLSQKQLDMLKRTMFDLSLLDQEEEPFTVWTSCNITISHVNDD
jgi:ubiquinone/menaquinone biosynthesis C-methylase UbiE